MAIIELPWCRIVTTLFGFVPPATQENPAKTGASSPAHPKNYRLNTEHGLAHDTPSCASLSAPLGRKLIWRRRRSHHQATLNVAGMEHRTAQDQRAMRPEVRPLQRQTNGG